jgi:hypothetical protein
MVWIVGIITFEAGIHAIVRTDAGAANVAAFSPSAHSSSASPTRQANKRVSDLSRSPGMVEAQAATSRRGGQRSGREGGLRWLSW